MIIHKVTEFVCRSMTVTAITLAISAHAGATSANEVVIASTGGAYDRALKEAWFDPFTEQTGIRVRIVSATNSEMRAKASAMVKAGNVSWDLYLDGEIQSESEAHRLVTEDLSEFVKHSLTGLICPRMRVRRAVLCSSRPQRCSSTGKKRKVDGSRGLGLICGMYPSFQEAGHSRILTIPGACWPPHYLLTV